MQKIYYLFSANPEEEAHEAIYICSGNDSIENPTLKTGVYPVGCFLSCFVKVLNPWYIKNFDSNIAVEKINEGLSNFSARPSSFLSLVNFDDDTAIRKIVMSLTTERKYIFSKRDYNSFSTHMNLFMNYVELCQNEVKSPSIQNLELLSNRNGISPLLRFEYPPVSLNSENFTSKEKLKKLFDNPIKENFNNERFTANLKRNKLFPDLNKKSNHESVFLHNPITIFEMHDMVDFFLASLQCIAEIGYKIGKCNYCKDLFVNERKVRYCPPISLSDKSCQQISNEQRQLEKIQNSKSRKKHKSIYTMLLQRSYNVADEKERKIREEECNIFLTKTQKLKDNLTPKEYIDWMNSYWEKVKKESKARKKNQRKK